MLADVGFAPSRAVVPLERGPEGALVEVAEEVRDPQGLVLLLLVPRAWVLEAQALGVVQGLGGHDDRRPSGGHLEYA